MSKKSILILVISVSVVLFIVREFSVCLQHSMPYDSYMKEHEFVISKVEMNPHIFAIYDETGYRFYVRDHDTKDVFDKLDSTLVNRKVKINYADWNSALLAITRNSRACKLQVGDSVYFDIIIPKSE